MSDIFKKTVSITWVLIIAGLLSFSFSQAVFADTTGGRLPNPGETTTGGDNTQGIQSNASGLVQNTDPSTVSVGDVRKTIVTIINWMLGFAALATVVFIIIGGYNWLTSAGDTNKVSKGKDVLTGAIIGLLMIILAAVLMNTIIAIFGN